MSAQIDQVLAQAANDPDVIETQEWLDALEAVIDAEGPERAHYLMERMVDLARRRGAHIPFSSNTAYVNTIPADQGEHCPGNLEIEERLRSWMRWNAMAMVVKANRVDGDLGGHLSSFASLANMLGIGFNHFWHAPTEDHGGDLLYIQGHSSPGIYARAFLEGRLTEDQLIHFRREADGHGLSSYPHPKLMPEFWQFPTVSMGLGPLMAIYQARFLKYLHARGIAKTDNRKVWAFCGDGEMDEPESMGAIGMAGREKLNNLVIVVNCNLQRLDGPVRGNGKIIQELESDFRGAGWNVVKVIWGSGWDELLAKDKEGILQKVMMETVDGEYQNYKAKDGAFVRKHFFGKHPKLLEMVSKMSDDDIWRLTRGGHDPHKIYAAFKVAQDSKDQPTVILAKSIKGYGFGKSGEARNTAHNTKKLDDEAIKAMRDRFQLPISDADLPNIPFFKPSNDTPEMQYLHERRKALGGYLPQRRPQADEKLVVPELSAFQVMLEPTAEGREISTTAAYSRVLTALLRDSSLGQRVVPIMVDESRTFGMEGLFRQIGIFSQVGQLYEPVDKDQVMYYREDKAGQILQEGINEAGGMSSWIAAATSYSTNNRIMIPFYTYYSMFGLQRIGDLAWAAGDMRARGFLIGGTAGRTTLNGEGLQHEDGHSHVFASAIPNCVPYDPTFAHEVAVIIHDGLRRMVGNQEDVFYYITVMNENYAHPGIKAGQEEGILKGLYLLNESSKKNKLRVQLLGSGTILREVIAAADLLRDDWKVDADVWSAPSFTLLARDGQDVERWNMLHPADAAKKSHFEQSMEGTEGPIVVSTDYMRTYAEQVRAFVPKGRTYKVLGTDGYGRSDTRAKLREFFEVDRHYVTVAALKSLADEGKIKPSVVAEAIAKYGINPEKPNPVTV
ncbi:MULTISPECIES: pyruvate dehydrogenase (acetyl-transferring), homodimeric type [unclassified Herbaspirillum]|uniref:pyruvate dehydrogenase (acetyl-transferring), homodimeric type n=1 Tax=unclassified Herbaspirillum TaxID=2624150 RepID=UPI000E2F7CA7|nr:MULTISPECIES: pyruvate dehydrogenase (acetyl-transferring), homodimeric type [unclassified Herbaspirillum]RFB74057.1 pyruvate dehydrogenase (acetyl-transferring), homodimeric type [Herbaspirillum sp. 3R-3a1]TFI10129.1 pyruvate dehydrogenase (acetyl-transferring), homodimeric type [Herbaspirillum sp. 3R11]TFI16034.1 pyruvate dehydrogenase (acetyl-transferring), homodimeric type [Herbaspirillum sp. 3R-11]TFI30466.1 pyruvate dehydrogenase (acetyl-transferring), homodimeric type [Herbaspirillum 